MKEWREEIQTMIDWMEAHMTEQPTLLKMSQEIGYSPYYCSTQFHRIAGMTLKTYLAGRRLCLATIQIRDTNKRILDIAMEYGYSSQEALTRAFERVYGCTPMQYRKAPRPLVFPVRKTVLFPEYYKKKEDEEMSQTCLTDAAVRTEYIPAHRYLGIWDEKVSSYCEFWERHSCDEVCGIIESLSNVMHPIVTAHTAGWFKNGEKRGYFYGLGVKDGYDGPIPEGFEVREFPASNYLVFYHPPFDFLKDCGEVMSRVENLAWNYDPLEMNAEWNEEECQDYQRHYPEKIGYEVLRPIRFKEDKK